MSTHKSIGIICCLAMAAAVLITVILLIGAEKGIVRGTDTCEYESKLFDTEKVHTIDIVMDDWDEFIKNAEQEEYEECTVVIDGEEFKSTGIRGKGNTSLTSVKQYGNNRYSFKLEFDHYSSGSSYYGLDKLNLNNLISDSTYMKDYLCYTMMRDMGVFSPLCSYVYVTVNGKDWGLYLAVEGVEEGFLERNYGTDYGNLYKPDSQSGGNKSEADSDGKKADGEDVKNGLKSNKVENQGSPDNRNSDGDRVKGGAEAGEKPEEAPPEGDRPKSFGDFNENEPSDRDSPPDMAGSSPSETPDENNHVQKPGMQGNGTGHGMAEDDVKLQYIDDSWKSYPNIFDNAKTNITDADRKRLIASLKTLSKGEKAETVVDIEKVTAYFAVHNFVCNGDSYTGTIVHNYYLYEEDGIMSMIPWDYNLAFGGFGAGGRTGTEAQATAEVNSPIDSPVSGGDLTSRPMVSWIFERSDYTELYHQQYSRFISEYFQSGYFEEMMEHVTTLIAPYVKKDPTAFCTYEEYQQGVKVLQSFCLMRAESVSGQLSGSIPSTESEQTADKSKLIDASSLNLKDMGEFSRDKRAQEQ